MSTRCLIGIEYPNNEYKYIYCHWDGYPEGVGSDLITYYNDITKINQLLDKGDISSLERTLEETEPLSEGQVARICSMNKIPNQWQDYIYMFKNNKWICKEAGNWESSTFNFDELHEVRIPE